MEKSPFISVLIPAYRRTAYLKRLLDSLAAQDYHDFEVIVTDDSDTDVVEQYLKTTQFDFTIRYFRNIPARGTPRNWMEGMQHAKGEWIKIIHDDDWLSNANSLVQFVAAAIEGVDVVFSGYNACYEVDGRVVDKTITQSAFQRILRHPYLLLADNKIGPPSVMMFRRSMDEMYDPSLKWLVDLEAYVRMMRRYCCVYVAQPLINMSYNETQVTNDCFRNPDVEVREALVFYRKFGREAYRHVLTYDAWWRMLRNLGIRNEASLRQYAHGESVPDYMLRMLRFQRCIPAAWLKYGICSKSFMFICYLTQR